ncbi:MAG: DevR family CRISPR-associated autoregulator [Thermoplasmata archaeon]|nr:MAG: DevR family CRISPR-associated autoregulator [Thermoplasmata archaeon]
MEYRSLAISFRIQLGFHAANNEGAGGTNVMEPRRITVGDKEYDGISGEIIRHHILEEFVKLCQENGVNLHQRCNGLVPDRCREEVKQWMQNQNPQVSKLDPEQHYATLAEKIIEECALCDVGGYLVALQKKQDEVEGTLKRDSCFEVGWLITEHPVVVDYTQHSAYDPDPEKHNLFVQNIRTGIYGGVLRIDLDRIGFNDWWWLSDGINDKYAIKESERKKRIRLLLESVRRWIMSPSFAKQAGWLQHMSGLLEGVIVLSKDGPAPFFSPIRFELENNDPTNPVIKPNPEYRDCLEEVKEKCGGTLELLTFDNPAQLEEKMKEVLKKFDATGETEDEACAKEEP